MTFEKELINKVLKCISIFICIIRKDLMNLTTVMIDLFTKNNKPLHKNKGKSFNLVAYGTVNYCLAYLPHSLSATKSPLLIPLMGYHRLLHGLDVD